MRIVLLAVLGGIASDALKLGAALVVGILILTLITLATLLALPLGLSVGVGIPPGDAPPLALGNPGEIPSEQLALMRQVAAATGIPWPVLAAIAKIESDFGRTMTT